MSYLKKFKIYENDSFNVNLCFQNYNKMKKIVLYLKWLVVNFTFLQFSFLEKLLRVGEGITT